MGRISTSVKPLLNRMSVSLSNSNMPGLSKLRGSTILNGQKAMSIKDFVKFSQNNDLGLSKQEAIAVAEEFKLEPFPSQRSSGEEKMINLE